MDTPPATSRLAALPPDQLAADTEAAALVARFTRTTPPEAEAEPVRVAAFNSYI